MKLFRIYTLVALVTAFAAVAAADTARFEVYADTTYAGTAGYLLKITDTFLDELENTVIESVTFFVVEEAGHVRLVALRDVGVTTWEALPAGYYLSPAAGANIGDTWPTLGDDFGRDIFSELNAFETTTVPAGSFPTAYCVQKPVDPLLEGPPVSETRHFAWGVGMVREAWPSDGWVDALTSYNVVGGSGYWPFAVGNWWEFEGQDASVDAVSGADDILPAINLLHGNYPNPFNPATKISFEMAAAGTARLSVYDAAGRLVRTLVDGQRGAGLHSVTWDGRDDMGRGAAAGVYLYRFEAGKSVQTRAMSLVK